MPPRYYDIRETDSYADVTVHADRDCPDGPARALPDSVQGEECPDCLAEDEPEDELASVEYLIDDGRCPWCDDYQGDHVGQHASGAHPEAWSEYKD